MRHLLAAASVLALTACQGEATQSTSAAQTAQPAPAVAAAPDNVVDALAPFYAQLDVDRPRAPDGAGEPAADAVLTTILFGSCHTTERDLSILDTVSAAEGDLFIYTGDNVYGDAYSWDATLPELRQAYQELADAAPFQRLRQSTPMLATWDDHDYGMNDLGTEFPYKGFAEELFLEFWGVPAEDERRDRPGIYTSRTYGPDGQRVQVILLDTRYFRGALRPTDNRGAPGRERYLPTEDTSVSMLGDVQWEWFEEVLQEPADVRLVVTSIQVHADGHGWEAWRTMPHERDRFYATIEESGAEGVILISGDRHSSGLYVRDDVIGYPLYEITSSSLNLSFAEENNEPGPNRIGEMYAPVNFGAVAIDWDNGDIRLEIRDDAGEVVRETGFNLAQLQRG
jgi:alkaline phosphatase D